MLQFDLGTCLLVSILIYKSYHILLECRCPIKKRDPVRPAYLTPCVCGQSTGTKYNTSLDIHLYGLVFVLFVDVSQSQVCSHTLWGMDERQCWRKSLDVKKLDYPPHGKCVLIFLGKQKSTAGMIVEVSLRKGAWPPYLSRTNFYFIILLVWREDYCITKKQKIQVPYSYYSTLPKSFKHFGCIFIFLASQRCKVESVQSCNVPNE